MIAATLPVRTQRLMVCACAVDMTKYNHRADKDSSKWTIVPLDNKTPKAVVTEQDR